MSTTLKIACINNILFVYFSLLFFPLSNSVSFQINQFTTNATDILLLGDAMYSDGAIEFNKVDNVPYHTGHAIYADAVQIWDSKSGKLSDFTTHFSFVIDTLGNSSHCCGLTFFIRPAGDKIIHWSSGIFFGLYNSTTRENYDSHIIHVEFDSFANLGDPEFEHVGINKNSLRSANFTRWNASLHSGEIAQAWISYNATTQMMVVSWRYATYEISRKNDTLSYQIDIRDVLPEWVTVGFSASTGVYTERHILQNWEFSSSEFKSSEFNSSPFNSSQFNPSAFNSSLIPAQTREGTSNKRKLAVGLVIPLGIIIIVTIAAYAMFRRKLRKDNILDMVESTLINADLEKLGAGPKRFSFLDLALATNNFSDDLKLGQGGFGCVYKGYLSREGMVVAVKKISPGSKQGRKEYITEVEIISSLRHRNLIKLIGWCHDDAQFLLVYEFLPNGSLDSHLFYNKSHLEWSVRYKIAMGLASALLYLHEECEQCVLHRDIKASNIMLDSGYNAKLGDFGLARFMDHELGIQTTGLAGTLGYMSPEYVTTGKASKDSDVYSFGIVVLEIACGQKVTGKAGQNSDIWLVQRVWDSLGKGELLSSVDQTLSENVNKREVECLMMVGLWCVHPDQSKRPSILQVIQVLKLESSLPNLPMKMPVPMYFVEPVSPEVTSTATITNTSMDRVR